MNGVQSARSLCGRATLALTGALVVASLGAGSAEASQTHYFEGIFGPASQPSFEEASRIAIDRSDGDLLVVDRGAGTVSRWHAEGNAAEFSALGSNVVDGKGGADQTPEEGLGLGSFNRIEIAVDNSGTATDGDIYLTGNADKLVNVFSSNGAYLGQLTGYKEGLEAKSFADVSGVTVDAAGALYVSDASAGKVIRFAPAANPPVNGDTSAVFALPSPRNLVAGEAASAGYLFVKGSEGEGVFKVSASSGTTQFKFLGSLASPRAPLAVDPANGHLYDQTTSGAVQEWDASGATAPSSPAAEFPLTTNLEGLAVTGSGKVELTREGSAHAEIYGPAVVVPDPLTGAASEVARTTATLNATVDPDGVELTHCSFEYGTTAAYGQSIPCEQSNAAIGAGHGAVAVSAGLAGLRAGRRIPLPPQRRQRRHRRLRQRQKGSGLPLQTGKPADDRVRVDRLGLLL